MENNQSLGNLNQVYDLAFQYAPFPCLISDKKGNILTANQAIYNCFGYTNKDLIDKNITLIFPSAARYLTQQTASRLFLSGYPENKHKGQTKEGVLVYVELTPSVFQLETEDIILWTIRCLSNETILFNLRERIKEQRALLSITETLFKTEDIGEAFQACVFYIQEGWQFPEYAMVRIKLANGLEYKTNTFVDSSKKLSATLTCHDEFLGTLEVQYNEDDFPTNEPSIFLKEEEILIECIAKLLSLYLDWRTSIKKLMENEQKFRKITSLVPANTYQFELNEKGELRFLFANKGFSRYNTSFTSQSLIDNPSLIRDLMHEDDKLRFTEYMKKAYQEGSEIDIQYRILIEGLEVWRWLRASPERTEDNKIIWYGSAQDITQFIDYVQTLEQILFDISHVIRKPVSTMLGLTELINNTLDEKTIKDFAKYFKTVSLEMDEYIKTLNDKYYAKRDKLNTYRL